MSEFYSDVVLVNPAMLIPHPRREEGGKRYDAEKSVRSLPFKYFALQADIVMNGIRVPLTVQAGTNVLIAGHFRRAVALDAGWGEVPVQYLDVDVDDAEAYALMLKDNWQRNDEINSDRIAIARNVKLVVDYYKLEEKAEKGVSDLTLLENRIKNYNDLTTMSKVRKALNMSRPTMNNYLKLLNLIPELQTIVREDRIDMHASVSLASLPREAQMEFFARYSKEERIMDKTVDLFMEQWETSLSAAKAGLSYYELKEEKVPSAMNMSAAPSRLTDHSIRDSLFAMGDAELNDLQETEWAEEDKKQSKTILQESAMRESVHINDTALKNIDAPESIRKRKVKQFDMAVNRIMKSAERHHQELKEAWDQEVIDFYSQPFERGFVHNNLVWELQRKTKQMSELMQAIIDLRLYIEETPEQ